MELEQRRAALARTLEEFTVAHDKVLQEIGLRLPRHVAYAIGWWQGLSSKERAYAAGANGVLGAAVGIGAWLAEGRFDRAIDLARLRTDPAELVCVFATDERRWGLWYDDPDNLPRTVARAEVHDVIQAGEPTLLGTFVEEIGLLVEDNQPFVEEGDDPLFDWLFEVANQEHDAHAAEAIAPFAQRPELSDGIGPWIDGWTIPPELDAGNDYATNDARIATARDKLATEPGWALVVGRELHAQEDAELHAIGTELLAAAYRALGRDALVSIVSRSSG